MRRPFALHLLRCAATLLATAALLWPARSARAQTFGSTGTTNTARPTTGSTGGTTGGNSSNGSAASTTRQYRNNTLLGDALIQEDPETRSLIIVADDDTQNEILKVIRNLDRPKPQILIKVLFAQVTLDNTLDFGVEGNYAFNLGKPANSSLVATAAQQAVSAAAAAIIPTPTTGTAQQGTNFGLAALANQSNGAFFTLNTQNAAATLYALATKGKVNVLSRPSILARNNQEAVIVVGQEVPIPTANQITEAGEQIQSVSYQDVGIILRVTPFITVNKNVEMLVAPEISSLSTQTVQISSNFAAPIINKTAAETVVVTPDSQTVVIGGLMQKQTSSTISKVPLLGDIPVLGHLFKRTTTSSDKTELLIFMTPYIVQGTDRLEELSVDQINRTDLPKETFSEKDVTQYLDSTLKLMPQMPPQPVNTTTTTTTTKTVRQATGTNGK
jgi:general secretion pathway protein D